jgi:hypothetical protein
VNFLKKYLFNFIAYALGQFSLPAPQAHPVQLGMQLAAQVTMTPTPWSLQIKPSSQYQHPWKSTNSGTSLSSQVSCIWKQNCQKQQVVKNNSKQRGPRTNRAACTIDDFNNGHKRAILMTSPMGTRGALSMTLPMDAMPCHSRRGTKLSEAKQQHESSNGIETYTGDFKAGNSSMWSSCQFEAEHPLKKNSRLVPTSENRNEFSI